MEKNQIQMTKSLFEIMTFFLVKTENTLKRNKFGWC